jgi:hypothetical protein
VAGDGGHRDVARVSLKDFGNGFKKEAQKRKDEVGALERRLSSKYCELAGKGVRQDAQIDIAPTSPFFQERPLVAR